MGIVIMPRALVLVANPGSASRKYALYEGDVCLANIHFEQEDSAIVYTLDAPNTKRIHEKAHISHVTFAATKLVKILQQYAVLLPGDTIRAIGLRVVAPASFFQAHRILNARAIEFLKELEPRASLHISATLQEVELLGSQFPGVRIVGASDSAFHRTKPDVASTYGIAQKDAKRLDIWRFGYHGLSVASVVSTMHQHKIKCKKLIVCHLGSGASITAIKDGKSVDTSMGYSPLEGLVMATRTGSIDPTATEALAKGMHLSEYELQLYLNTKSGLVGVSGNSSDIRVLLELEKQGNEQAKLALQLYVYRIQQTLGQMAASLNGLDCLVFTGTVGARSAEIRKRIVRNTSYLGVSLDATANRAATDETVPVVELHAQDSRVPVYVVIANEAASILEAIRTTR